MPPDLFTAAQIGELLDGIKATTVMRYLRDSRDNGRYNNHPFPPPAGYKARSAYWTSDQLPDLFTWAKTRKGRGVGGGPKRKAAIS